MKKIFFMMILAIAALFALCANETYNGFYKSGFTSVEFKSSSIVKFDDGSGGPPNGVWNRELNYSLSPYGKAQMLKVSGGNFEKSFLTLKSDYCLVLYDLGTSECVFTGAAVSFNATEGLSFPTMKSASSELKEKDKVYGVKNLANFNSDSPWCEGVEGAGAGESIRMGVNARKLIIIPGYVSAKKPQLFEYNSRPKTITVVFKDSKTTKEYELKDTPAPQVIDFGEVYGGEIEIVIKSVYPGSKYEDTCISTIFSMYF